jgi:hypothetical protein
VILQLLKIARDPLGERSPLPAAASALADQPCSVATVAVSAAATEAMEAAVVAVVVAAAVASVLSPASSMASASLSD